MSLTRLQVPRGLVKNRNEFPPDPLPLFFRVRNAFELSKESVRGVHTDHMQAQPFPIHGQRVFKFILAEQAGVYKDVRQAVADSLVNENRRDGGIDATT